MQVLLPLVPDGVTFAAVESAYNLAQTSLSGYIAQVHGQWYSSISSTVQKELEAKLLVASPQEGGLLTCNFSKTALMLFQEVSPLDALLRPQCVSTKPVTQQQQPQQQLFTDLLEQSIDACPHLTLAS